MMHTCILSWQSCVMIWAHNFHGIFTRASGFRSRLVPCSFRSTGATLLSVGHSKQYSSLCYSNRTTVNQKLESITKTVLGF